VRFDRVFFDSGGTLYGGGDGGGGGGSDPSPAEVHEGRFARLGALAASFGLEVPPAELGEAVRACEDESPSKWGAAYSFVRLVEDVFERLGLAPAPEVAAVLADAYAGPRYRSWLYPGTPEMVEALHGAGLHLGIIANTGWPGFTMDRAFRGVGLLSFFRTRVYSCDVSIDKPDERIFRLATELSGLPSGHDPSRILYVGNSLVHDIEGAAGVGWRTALRRSTCETSGGLADFEFDESGELTEYVLSG